MRFLSIGDNVIDYYKFLNKKFPGGNAVNVSVYMKQHGVNKSKYIGIIGNDEEGKIIKEALIKENVDIEGVRIAEGDTGLTIVNLNEHGDRVFDGWNNGGVQSKLKLNFSLEELNEFKDYDLMHTSVYSYLESELYILKEYIDISFDFSTSRDHGYIQEVSKHLKYAFFSGEDLSENEMKDLFTLVHSQGVEFVVITQGIKGSIASYKGKFYKQKAFPVEAIDTLGAGDKYISTFLFHIAKGDTIKYSMEMASKKAAKVCIKYGAF